MHARWEGSPISVYVDDASKTLPFFYRSLATFAPFWVSGETVILLMDFYRWRKTGAPKDQCQQHVVEAISDCFTPIAHEGRATESPLAMFRYTAPLGTGAWAWLLKQAAKAAVAASNAQIQKLRNSTSWRITAPLRQCADGGRGIFGRGGSSKG